MYKGNITAPVAITANTNIPLNTVLNTNCNTSYENGVITIKGCGYYNINVTAELTGVAAGAIQLQLYNNGVALPDAIAGATSGAATSLYTLNIADAIKVGGCQPVKLSLRATAAATVNSAIVTVERVR